MRIIVLLILVFVMLIYPLLTAIMITMITVQIFAEEGLNHKNAFHEGHLDFYI